MTIVQITGVDVAESRHDGSSGHYIDDDGVLQSVVLDYGEAKAILVALSSGAESVGYEVPEAE